MSLHPITIHPIPGFTEPFASLSHLLGAVMVLAFAIPLLRRGAGRPGPVAALGVFALSAFFALTMSGVYHLLPRATLSREVLCRLDHAGIFFLIAGSFTPPHVILFRGPWRWGVLLPVWALAVAGMTLTAVYSNAIPDWFILTYYLGLGWIGAISGIKVWRTYGFAFIRPIVLGGLAYTAGALLDFNHHALLIPGVIESHELFHVAVLIGLAFHWHFMVRIADRPALITTPTITETLNLSRARFS